MSNFGLDAAAGLMLWQEETYGDWYRDPWDWPECWWLRKYQGTIDFKDHYDPSTRRLRIPPIFHLMDVPKSHLGIRPAVIQDPLSRFMYLTAAASVMPKIHAGLPDFVFGWRHRDDVDPSKLLTAEADEGEKEWDMYLAHVREGESSSAGLRADLTSFFASINVTDLLIRLKEALGVSAAYSIIDHVVDEHNKSSRRSGLSQRSFASAALANFFLRRVDNLLSKSFESGQAERVARWMDDIVAFGDSENLYQLYIELQEVVRTLGLELNTSKGRLGTAQEAVQAIVLEQIADIKVKSKVVQSEYTGRESKILDRGDLEVLYALEEFALKQGAAGTRPWLRAALSSLVNNKVFRYQEKWLENAKNIPHVADNLGRYLRSAARFEERDVGDGGLKAIFGRPLTWVNLCEWLVSHLKSPWCSVDWVKAQLALSVPSRHVSRSLLEIFREWFSVSNNAQLLAVAGQRLSKLDPTFCWETVRTRSDDVRDPLIERVFSLCVLSTGLDMPLAQQIARKNDANKLLILAMEDIDWRHPKVSKDFDDR
ncbi:reverse transcriptase domain-containing protein [Amycolatopsis japonica]|uniref:reverse transcriptase domain-containing protein n=1 Tax=Amycolatopsis japonica TaxID=208439 RepID=UPI0037F5F31B